MRSAFLGLSLSALLLATGLPVQAQPRPPAGPPVSDIRVVIGPDLRKKATDLNYGQGEVAQLADDLHRDLQRELGRVGRLGPGGVRLDLAVTDAAPNHPTHEQMSRQPGLDYLRSVSKGGATIDGFEIRPDGSRHKIHFSYFEDSLRMAQGQSTWGDAENTLDWFARDYANGRK
jgi:hypothetical protein